MSQIYGIGIASPENCSHTRTCLLSMQIWESILWVYLSLVLLAIHNYSFRAFHRDFDKPAQFTLINCVVVKMQNKWLYVIVWRHARRTCCCTNMTTKSPAQPICTRNAKFTAFIWLPLMRSEKYGKNRTFLLLLLQWNALAERSATSRSTTTEARHKKNNCCDTAARKSLNK